MCMSRICCRKALLKGQPEEGLQRGWLTNIWGKSCLRDCFNRMELLLHICCANCATYPISVVKELGITVKGLWFNPNIHPFTEYKNRLEALKKLQQLWGLDIEYNDYYGLHEYLRNVVGNEGNRCEYCYTTRLEQAALKAQEIKADAFSTTLLVSPYQRFDLIIDI